MRNQEEKMELHKKVHKRICVKDITFFWLHALLPMSFFVVLFSPTPSFLSTPILLRKNNFAPENGIFHSIPLRRCYSKSYSLWLCKSFSNIQENKSNIGEIS